MAEDAEGKYGIQNGAYGVVTLHRPFNGEQPETSMKLCDVLRRIAANLPPIFPEHPRTRKNLEAFGLYVRLAATPGMHLDEPVMLYPIHESGVRLPADKNAQ